MTPIPARVVTIAAAAVVFLSLTGGVAVAQEASTVCGYEVGALIDTYNANVDAVPGLARGLIAGETVHLVVDGDPNGEYAAVTASDGRITTFDADAPASPSVRVSTDCGTVEAVVTADDPVAAFQTAYDDGDVTISGVGPVRTVVVEVVEALVGLARSLGLF